MEQVKVKGSKHTEVIHEFEICIERPKPSAFDELIALLKKILNYCICVVTCGCVAPHRSSNGINGEEYGTLLLDDERIAVENLLTYLETENCNDAVVSPQHLRALCILTYSDNNDLQRSAALCFAEFSEKMCGPLTTEMAVPLVQLLHSADVQVQRVASHTVSKFLVVPYVTNKEVLASIGVLTPLNRLLFSSDPEVLCNTCGCIAALATADCSQQQLYMDQSIKALLSLLKSAHVHIQHNAAGAILNLTRSQCNRNELVSQGALPVLVDMLHSPDEEIQYTCIAALSNVAVHEKHRAMMVAIGNHDVILQLISLMYSRQEKIKCQACFAVRNLASDGDQQVLFVRYGILEALHKVMKATSYSTQPLAAHMLAAALGCLRNLSILKANELSIVSEDFLPDMCRILNSGHNWEAQRHAAGTIRNIAVGDHIQAVLESECLEALCWCLLDVRTKSSAHADITAALAVLADEDDVKSKLLALWNGGMFGRLVSLASLSISKEVQYNSAGIVGQLALHGIPDDLRETNKLGIVLYIDKFLKSKDQNFLHIGLWTLSQLLNDPEFVTAFKDHHIDHVIRRLLTSSHSPAIIDLAQAVQDRLLGAHQEHVSDTP
ncbi:vacuolar protein 8-like isoform X1 [Haliotis rufescens]|uniref:vacuolar protein 8-like isoform X1 n=1 Tax=Haliotis rufescens TaxID=6454 RepID=UPI00201F6277|nr:vacuolar protein 8-like isoform X1 [Haliotis rufescens]